MEGPDPPGLILVVMWHGHRVPVSADGWLGPERPRPSQRLEAHADIASAIASAASAEDIGPGLRASPVGRTHDVAVSVVDGEIEVSLRERWGPDRAVPRGCPEFPPR